MDIALTAGRYAIRLQDSRKLQWDDAIQGLALAVLIAYCATYATHYQLYYDVEYYAAGTGPSPSTSDIIVYFKTEVAVTMLFWVIVYLVKFAFLMLYRTIFWINPLFRKAWWVVAAFTGLTFLLCFISSLWGCGKPSDLFIPGESSNRAKFPFQTY